MPAASTRSTPPQVNTFLREIAGIKISLKDFRTLMASARWLKSLSRITPATSERGRKKQVLDAVRSAADELSNTPAICRKSYVHDTIVTAFEDGILARIASTQNRLSLAVEARAVTGAGGGRGGQRYGCRPGETPLRHGQQHVHTAVFLISASSRSRVTGT